MAQYECGATKHVIVTPCDQILGIPAGIFLKPEGLKYYSTGDF